MTLTGDASIQKRPMKRIIDPLSQMGADIESVNGNGCAPLHITGSPLHGIHYQSPVASAQVKSSILLAGLYADGETRVTEPYSFQKPHGADAAALRRRREDGGHHRDHPAG